MKNEREIRSAYYGGMLITEPKMHLLIEKDLKSQLEEDAALQAMYLALIMQQSKSDSMLPFYILIALEIIMLVSLFVVRFL